jgi:hypothetical protein
MPTLTVAQLRGQAQRKGIPGLWKMNKAQLMRALGKTGSPKQMASGAKVRAYISSRYKMGTCADLVEYGVKAREQGKTWAQIKDRVDRSVRLSKKNGLKVACFNGRSQRYANKKRAEKLAAANPLRPGALVPVSVPTPSYQQGPSAVFHPAPQFKSTPAPQTAVFYPAPIIRAA